MNKDDVYQIIGYQGEYNASVKKAIRKLLKENHPDNQGNKEKFELINEVKIELENDKVPLKYKKKTTKEIKNISDIDYEYCYKMINSLNKERDKYLKELDTKNKKLTNLEKEYRMIYRNSVDLELNLLTSSKEFKQIQSIKTTSIIMLIAIAIVFMLSIIKSSIVLFIVFLVLSFICVFIVHKYFFIIQKMTKNNKLKIKEYIKVNNNINDNLQNHDQINKEILNLKKKIKTIENDLRFYKNLLK